ncbi:MAG: elongator complex protein 3 [Parcubacteria group bacterium Athens1014_10]|nr:MAG: elongator complex protein 3 [Parcubacteria group bacterium Athens1014_10]TSD04692.1 MAG: elongator complex protein 3 [Parcubacteria group bacterium Athens0714_12]
MEKIIKKIIKLDPKDINELALIKRKLAKSFNISLPPHLIGTGASGAKLTKLAPIRCGGLLPNIKLLAAYRQLLKNKKIKRNLKLETLFKKRAVRTLSGVAVIAVLTKPYPCPGKCFYCPSEKKMPKSYLSNEPAVMRAILCEFDPYKQVKTRLDSLEITGHLTDKVELIIMGGAWTCLPGKYQTWFVKRCFDALNNKTFKTLPQAQNFNEKAKHRCVSLTLETRPDYINEQEIKRMRQLGCTKVEIGAQTLDDSILQLNQRGHNAEEIIRATKILKDAGFKVCYHMMPNLPGSDLKKDLETFKKLFNDSDFRPDYLKIYPCVVTKNSPLYKAWKQGEYKPYSEKSLLELLIKIKKIIPPYVRVSRLIRDIPSNSIEAGNKVSNLRELIQKEMNKRGERCRCIRCREIKNLKFQNSNLKLKILSYPASKGREYFLSFEDVKNDKLIAFLRLRLSDDNSEILKLLPELSGAAMVREIHTYGLQVPIDKKNKSAAQHFGFGKKLMREAEKIAKKQSFKKMAVISGIGAREYYQKLGYKLEGTYMVKSFSRINSINCPSIP